MADTDGKSTDSKEIGGSREQVLAAVLLQAVTASLGRGREWSTTLSDADFYEESKTRFNVEDPIAVEGLNADTFEFKEYAPRVFEDIRREGFDAKSAMFRTSLCSEGSHLMPLGNLGRSGAFIFNSYDRRFIVKTISRKEGRFLLNLLKDYHTHITKHPESLITRTYGLWRLRVWPRGQPAPQKFRFLAMNSVFAPAPRSISSTFDLKGSFVNRRAKHGASVKKDQDLLDEGREFCVPEAVRDKLLAQLRLDCSFLSSLGIMDYSLLVGVVDGAIPAFRFGHKIEQNVFGNVVGKAAQTSRRRPKTMAFAKPSNPLSDEAHKLGKSLRRVHIQSREDRGVSLGGQDKSGSDSQLDVIETKKIQPDAMRRVQTTAPKQQDSVEKRTATPPRAHTTAPGKKMMIPSSVKKANGDEDESKSNDVGIRSQSDQPASASANQETYLLGLIDFLQPYQVGQRAARVAKRTFLCQSWTGISTVPPDLYCERFLDAMERYFTAV